MADKPISLDTQEPTDQEVHALRALAAGEADAGQQRKALQLIVRKFARGYDVAFVPGAPDQSAFLAGRGFVAQLVFKYLKLDLSKLPKPEGDTR